MPMAIRSIACGNREIHVAKLNLELAARIREIRRRHFAAPGGKAELARRLEIDTADYERAERGEVPSGEMLVRLCELTGEDLQWLLTGVASRGTVVIAGARNRHQALLTHIARIIDDQPALAAPIEAFVDLLIRRPQSPRSLVAPTVSRSDIGAGALIPVFDLDELPDNWPPDDGGGLALARQFTSAEPIGPARPAALHTVHSAGQIEHVSNVSLISLASDQGVRREFIVCDELSDLAPRMFATRTAIDPAISHPANAIVISSPDCEARLGAMALCKCVGRTAVCRVWLGGDETEVRLGRSTDGQIERVPRGDFRWASDALFWVAVAA